MPGGNSSDGGAPRGGFLQVRVQRRGPWRRGRGGGSRGGCRIDSRRTLFPGFAGDLAFDERLEGAADARDEIRVRLAAGGFVGRVGEEADALLIVLVREVAGVALAQAGVIEQGRAGVRGEDRGGHRRAAQVAGVDAVQPHAREAPGELRRLADAQVVQRDLRVALDEHLAVVIGFAVADEVDAQGGTPENSDCPTLARRRRRFTTSLRDECPG
jgi:hypothetical protein